MFESGPVCHLAFPDQLHTRISVELQVIINYHDVHHLDIKAKNLLRDQIPWYIHQTTSQVMHF